MSNLANIVGATSRQHVCCLNACMHGMMSHPFSFGQAALLTENTTERDTGSARASTLHTRERPSYTLLNRPAGCRRVAVSHLIWLRFLPLFSTRHATAVFFRYILCLCLNWSTERCQQTGRSCSSFFSACAGSVLLADCHRPCGPPSWSLDTLSTPRPTE